MKLVTAQELTRKAFGDMIEEYVLAGTPFLGITNPSDFPFFVRTCVQHSMGIGLGKGVSPYTRYFLLNDEDIVVVQGDLRHKPTAHNLNYAGQLGYGTVPSYRGKGYATILCHELLNKAREMDLSEVIITCNDTNHASARVIEKNGGILIEVRHFLRENVDMRRYKVDLTK